MIIRYAENTCRPIFIPTEGMDTEGLTIAATASIRLHCNFHLGRGDELDIGLNTAAEGLQWRYSLVTNPGSPRGTYAFTAIFTPRGGDNAVNS